MRTILFFIMLATALPTAASDTIIGKWRIERAEKAPWVDASFKPDDAITKRYLNQTIHFRKKKIVGPALLACSKPNYTYSQVPAEGLFQGGLAETEQDIPQARTTALKIGFTTQPVHTVTTSCDHDIAFHMSDKDHAAFALDNMIFWLKRLP